MKVFLSWSGTNSRKIATAFHDWLPYVIQAANPFMSAGDIEKGKPWSATLATELGEVKYGIICITQDNFRDPWINFEAGAISKAIAVSNVSPFLFNVEPARIQGPLTQFQFTANSKEDIFSLIRSINSKLPGDQQVTNEVLSKEFETWWPKLADELNKVAALPAGTGTGLDWLYTVDALAEIQSDLGCKCVWFITPDLYRNALIGKTKNAIRKNLGQGTNYEFIIPQSGAVNPKEVLLQLAESTSGKIDINDNIPADEFRSLAVTDYLIMNAESGEPQVFLELPVPERGYWIKVEPEAAMGLRIRFSKYVQKPK